MPASVVYTVSQVTSYIKALFTDDELLHSVWLTGEVSNFKQAASGHCYFVLKDANSSLKAVIWRTQALGMRLPREGDAVNVHGALTVYEPRGEYQIIVDRLEAGGVGWLWQEFQRMREQLEREGLFAQERKRLLPARPCRLGVATSADAAALRDILRTLANRCPLVEVVLAPTPVQGAEAPAGIVAAIALLNRWSAEREPLDAIIVARGGGSIEELWAFNDERVARAIAASAVPVISGVGHETDFTIADFVADLRAPTPTGAATAAVPALAELRSQVEQLAAAVESEMEERLDTARTGYDGLATRLDRASPRLRLASDRQRVDDLLRRASLATRHELAAWRERLAGQRLFLSGLDPQAVLARGYAIVSTADGQIVARREEVSAGDRLHVRVSDGTFDAEAK